MALLFVVLGCNNGSGRAGDAATGADAGADAPTVQPDAPADSPAASPDAPADALTPQADAPPDVRSDAIGDAVILDAGGDAGPFSCAAGLTCAANQYCEPQCCSGCVLADGGVCPTGTTSCPLGGGAGCQYCTAARCVNTIPLGCNVGGVGEPRRLFCLCG